MGAGRGHVGSLRVMSSIAIRRLLRRRRHHLALISVVVALAAVIVVHHSAMSTSSMDHAMGTVTQLCLGVFAAVGAAVVAVAIGVLPLRLGWPLLIPAPSVLPGARLPIARARDGPALLVLLCVCRR